MPIPNKTKQPVLDRILPRLIVFFCSFFIDSLGNYYAIRDNTNLKFVNASVNQISSINVLSILPGIVEINLSNNTIHKIAPNTFLGKTNLARVHLERNR